MTLSVAAFKADIRFRAFAELEDAEVQDALDAAALEIDTTVWGDLADKGQGLLAAHELAMTPFGTQAGLRAGAGANQTSVFWSGYDDLRKRVGTAYRPIVDDPGIV